MAEHEPPPTPESDPTTPEPTGVPQAETHAAEAPQVPTASAGPEPVATPEPEPARPKPTPAGATSPPANVPPSGKHPEQMGASHGGISPKILLLLAILLGAGVLVASIYLNKPKPVMASRRIGARLDLAAGDVTLIELDMAGKPQEPRKVLSGSPLPVGARVATGKGARALVRSSDGASLFLRGESEIILGDKGFSLERGEAWLDAPKVDGDAIEATIGVYGLTAMDAGVSIARDGDAARVYVARGLAILRSPGGRVEINAGEEGTAKAGEAPKVAPVVFWQDWTGGMGDARPSLAGAGAGSGRIYGLDPDAMFGSAALKLGIARQSVRTVIRDGIAETEVDQTFSNPGGRPIEGWYWFTVPENAIVTSFALETRGQLVEGEVVEKREAAAKYSAAMRSGDEPALLEWIDGRSYRAKIYPIPAAGTRRVVLRYMEVLQNVEGTTRWVYPMRSPEPLRFDEFSLAVDLGDAGEKRIVATSSDARIEDGGRKVTMRRSGFQPRADFQIELSGGVETKPVRAFRFEGGADQADYVMLRYTPAVDFSKLPTPKGEVVVVVDTSAGGDEAARKLRVSAAEAILRALADDDRFALIALDVTPTVVYPEKGLANATAADIAKALEKLSDHSIGGATDLGAMFEPALERLHGTEQPAIVYVGDGTATSGETSPEALVERMRRSLSSSRARVFTVGAGMEVKDALLTQIAREGSGRYFRVTEPDQATSEALRISSAIKTPTITNLEVDLGAGLDQPFLSTAGKLARGEELFLVARTHHVLPPKVKIRGRVGGKDFTEEHDLKLEDSLTRTLVPRLWAHAYMRRLLGGTSEAEARSKILDLGLEYGLITPYTSIIALESEAAFGRQGIRRRDTRLRGVRLSAIETKADERALGLLWAPGALSSVIGCSKFDDSSPTSSSRAEKSEGSRKKTEERNEAEPTAVAAAPTDDEKRDDKPAMAGAKDKAASTTVAPKRDDGDRKAGPSAGLDDLSKSDSKEAEKKSGGDFARAKPGGSLKDPATEESPTSPVGKAGEAVPAASASAAAPPVVAVIVPVPPVGTPPGPAPSGGIVVTKPPPPPPLPPKKPWSPPKPKPLSRCSDAASRPLVERIILWEKRLKNAQTGYDLTQQYDIAKKSCELPDWRDEAALLDRIQRRIVSEGAVDIVLSYLTYVSRDAQLYVARAILRRAMDPALSAAVTRVLFGGINWLTVDRELLEKVTLDERIAHLRKAMLANPGDPRGDYRLVRLLVEKGDRVEALAHGRRLRDRGLLTPELALLLGDVLADAGEKDESIRTYSEMVEFDPESVLARRALGDVFMRRGWYPAAYRQFKTLTDLDPKNPLSWLRLANAAAGSGRIDEALRIDREVASAEGTPGPEDPRMFAKLASASRLALLLADPSPAGGKDAIPQLARKAKELSLFSGPGTLALLLWDDLDGQLSLGSTNLKDPPVGDVTDASDIGLYSALCSTDVHSKTTWAVRWKTEPPKGRKVNFRVLSLTWDGKNFTVKVQKGEIGAATRQVDL